MSAKGLIKESVFPRPRVLFIDHTGEMGGAEFSLLGLVQNLPVQTAVTLLSPGPLLEKLIERGISAGVLENAERLVSLGRETCMVARLWSARRLPVLVGRLAMQAKNYNMVYVNSKKALLFGIIAARLAGKPLIWHQRDEVQLPALLPLRARLSESLLVWLLNRYATRIVSVSRACADAFIAAGGRPDLPVVIHNGLDPARYTVSIDRPRIRASAGLPTNAPLLGCFGRLTSWKGQDSLIDAIALVPNVHIVLVGGAVFGDRGYEAKLRAQVNHLQLSHRVHFLGHRDDVPELMRAMDVIVHPSIEFDPCPRVVIEALHSAVPLIATGVGGVPELVEDGKSGLIVPPSNPQALAKAILRVLRNPLLSEHLSCEGRHRAVAHFTLDRVIAEVNQEICSVINSCNPAVNAA